MTQEMDWNLLAALDALLTEGSVTAAADRLHLSGPATSRTLGRIRRTFGDPMLVRAGRGLVPTARATAIQQRLHQLMEEAHTLMAAGAGLDLATLERSFTLRANDALTCRLAGPLLARLAASAPRVTVRFVPEGDEDLGPLRDGQVDIDIGVISGFGDEVRTELLGAERFVGLVAGGHPLTRRRVTLDRIAALDHVAVSRRGRRRGPFDAVLAGHGLTRRVVAVVPTFTVAAHLVATSSCTGLFPAGYAEHVAAITGAAVYEVPADLEPAPISQAWHARLDLDPAHRWLRQEIAAILAPGPPA